MGRELHPPPAATSKAGEPEPRVSPEAPGKRRTPRTPAASVSVQPVGPGLAPCTHTRVHSTRSSRTFLARRGALAPCTPSVAALRDSLSLLSPPWRWQKAAEPSALTATSGAAKPARTTPNGSGRGSLRTPAGAPRNHPARAQRQACDPALGSGLGTGKLSWAVGSSSHPRLRVESPSSSREGGD